MQVHIKSLSLVGILSVSLIGLAGCGEKRIHVSTASGSPGDELQSSASDQSANTPNGGTTGLQGNSVDESSLKGKGSSTDGSLADAVQPVPPLEPLNFAYKPTLPTLPEEIAEPSISPDDLSIEDQESEISKAPAQPTDERFSDESGRQPQLSSNVSNPDIDLPSPSADAADRSAPFSDGQEIATQSTSSTSEPGESVPFSGSTSAQDDVANALANVEPVPESVQVAKAEPSDILREQLDKIKEEELATVSAGLEDVFFQFDSWTLTAEAKESLERDLAWLTNTPSSQLVIEGHADQRGTQAYNMVLGKKRATTIRDYLSQLGVDPSRLSVISYGKDKPFCQDATEVCHQLNRRGHLLVQN